MTPRDGTRWKVGLGLGPSNQAVLLSAASSPLHSQPTPSSRPCRQRSAVSSPHEPAAPAHLLGCSEAGGPRLGMCLHWEGEGGASIGDWDRPGTGPLTFTLLDTPKKVPHLYIL